MYFMALFSPLLFLFVIELPALSSSSRSRDHILDMLAKKKVCRHRRIPTSNLPTRVRHTSGDWPLNIEDVVDVSQNRL